LLLVVEDHPVCGEVEPPALVALEHGAALAREAHIHVVAEQEDAEREDADVFDVSHFVKGRAY
jgi:hypothetical protein